MSKSVTGDQGFTLVELLVSLALLSLMTIYTVNAFTSLRDMSRVAENMPQEQEIDAALRHIRGAIADARPYFLPDGQGGQKLLFEGSSTILTFVTASTGERERGGLYAVTLSLAETGELTEHRRLLGNPANGDGTRTVLLRGIEGLSFHYFGADVDSNAQGGGTWLAPNRLPAAIKVRMTTDAGKQELESLTELRLSSS